MKQIKEDIKHLQRHNAKPCLNETAKKPNPKGSGIVLQKRRQAEVLHLSRLCMTMREAGDIEKYDVNDISGKLRIRVKGKGLIVVESKEELLKCGNWSSLLQIRG